MPQGDQRELERLVRNRLRAYRRANEDLPDAVRTARALGLDITDIAKEAGVARTTVYRALKETTVTTPDTHDNWAIRTDSAVRAVMPHAINNLLTVEVDGYRRQIKLTRDSDGATVLLCDEGTDVNNPNAGTYWCVVDPQNDRRVTEGFGLGAVLSDLDGAWVRS